MAKARTQPGWQSAIQILAGAVVFSVVVGALYWAQSIFIPLALAGFLTFVLTPLVNVVQRLGLGRTFSVIIVVLLTILALIGVGSLVGHQFTSLLDELPKYGDNIKAKIRSLQQSGNGFAFDHINHLISDIGRELSGPDTPAPNNQQPVPVVVHPEGAGLLARLPQFLTPLVGTLGISALATVLVVFMLIRREDMRNRLIRLVGHGQLVEATRAVDDASRRVSRFLLMQAIINGSAGFCIGAGLSLIGLKHGLLWGFLVALLRYVPYLGIWVAASLPLLMSIATSEGWAQPFEVIAVIFVVELIAGNVAEPSLFGQSIGVSEVSLLLAAAFWAFLWGPVGLVLASPMTVCLVVLGKYVPWLHFVEILLADEPALEPRVAFYQRLLAHDPKEARKLAMERSRILPLVQVYDELLLPALRFANRDHQAGELSDAEHQAVCEEVADLLNFLREQQAQLNERSGLAATPQASDLPLVLACPARDESDHLGLEMLQDTLDRSKWRVEIVPVETLTGEVLTRAAEHEPAVVCIAALPPGGVNHARYLCKRLRRRFPGIRIVVGRWGRKGSGLNYDRRRLADAGADDVTDSLTETVSHTTSWPTSPSVVAPATAGAGRKNGRSPH